MDYEQSFECWYKNVCQQSLDGCCGQLACIRYMEMKHLMDTSNIPIAKQYPISLSPGDKDYDAFCQLADLKDNIDTFVSKGDKNIYICSEYTGNGKTTWAIKLMLKYFDSIWAGNGFRTRGYFQHVPTFFNVLKDFSKDHSALKNTLETADLIIWDDIAVSGISQYDYNNLLIFIDGRLLNNRCNIFTSNRTSKAELEKAIGSRLASRIWETSIIIEFKGKDRRNG